MKKEQFKIRDYQEKLSTEHVETLHKYKILYYVMQQRVGKTVTSLLTIQKYCDKYLNKKSSEPSLEVLFITGKKIIKDIKVDIYYLKSALGNKFNIKINIINYEMLHKIEKNNSYTFFILDEPQTIGAFPKPNLRARQLKEIIQNKFMILLSGTPNPESYSQLYHQFWVSVNSPFKQWDNFYSWVRAGFVEPHKILITGRTITIYKDANENRINQHINKLMVKYSQKDAGFTQEEPVNIIRLVPMSVGIYKLINILNKKRYYKFNNFEGEIICDTAVSLQQKVHQISSGTIIATHPTETYIVKKKIYDPVKRRKIEVEIQEPKKIYKILDESKAKFIKSEYKNKKIAIYYKFINEGNLLEKTFKTTKDHFEFNKSNDKDLIFISQFRSGSRGISIKTADIIIAYNIDFSYEIYSQFRQRMMSKERESIAEIHWLFSVHGIEGKIYSKVLNKESYTLKYYMEDYMSRGEVGKKDKEKELSIKNAIYKLAISIQNVDASIDMEMLEYCKEKFIETGLLESKDFETPFGEKSNVS